jgi:hypothetical protein
MISSTALGFTSFTFVSAVALNPAMTAAMKIAIRFEIFIPLLLFSHLGFFLRSGDRIAIQGPVIVQLFISSSEKNNVELVDNFPNTIER